MEISDAIVIGAALGAFVAFRIATLAAKNAALLEREIAKIVFPEEGGGQGQPRTRGQVTLTSRDLVAQGSAQGRVLEDERCKEPALALAQRHRCFKSASPLLMLRAAERNTATVSHLLQENLFGKFTCDRGWRRDQHVSRLPPATQPRGG